MSDPRLNELIHVLHALEDYRASVVLIGGLVPLVYRTLSEFQPTRHNTLVTLDIDLAVPETLPMLGTPLREVLKQNGYVAVHSRLSDPPIQFFQREEFGTDTLAATYIEFLAPLKGSETDRTGNPKSPKEVQQNLRAQLLRYLDLLLIDSISVTLDSIEFRVPSPASYVVQKVLASQRRGSREGTEKDLTYVYDVVMLLRGRWERIESDLNHLCDKGKERQVREAIEILTFAFADEDSSGSRGVNRVLSAADSASAPSTTAVAIVMNEFLAAIALGR